MCKSWRSAKLASSCQVLWTLVRVSFSLCSTLAAALLLKAACHASLSSLNFPVGLSASAFVMMSTRIGMNLALSSSAAVLSTARLCVPFAFHALFRSGSGALFSKCSAFRFARLHSLSLSKTGSARFAFWLMSWSVLTLDHASATALPALSVASLWDAK